MITTNSFRRFVFIGGRGGVIDTHVLTYTESYQDHQCNTIRMAAMAGAYRRPSGLTGFQTIRGFLGRGKERLILIILRRGVE